MFSFLFPFRKADSKSFTKEHTLYTAILPVFHLFFLFFPSHSVLLSVSKYLKISFSVFEVGMGIACVTDQQFAYCSCKS